MRSNIELSHNELARIFKQTVRPLAPKAIVVCLAFMLLVAQGCASCPTDSTSQGEIDATSHVDVGPTSAETSRVHAILDEDGDVNLLLDSGRTPLTLAVESGDDSLVSRILLAGSDVNQTDSRGTNPLGLAIAMERDDIVELLIAKGADVNIRGPQRMTPLHYAVASGRSHQIARLLSLGADPNAHSALGTVPLNYVHSVADARLLIDAGACPDGNGAAQPPVHSLAGHSLELVQFMLAAGADPFRPDSNEQIAADHAKWWSNEEVYEFLRELEKRK